MSLNEALKNFNGYLKRLKHKTLRIYRLWSLNFFREVLGRLASTVDVSDIQDVDQSNPAIIPSSQG